MMEVWKDIPNTNGKLQASNMGQVRSQMRNPWRVLKTQPDNNGYLRLTYVFEREKRREKIHKLVAELFIPTIDGKTHVNHLNGIKTDNRVNNLEWCTNKENAHHAIKIGLWEPVIKGAARENNSRKRPVMAFNIINGYIKQFGSVSDAERACKTRHVCAVLHGKRTKANGYKFSYAE